MPSSLTTRRHFNAIALTLACTGLGAAQATPKAPGPVLVLGDSLSAEYGLPRGSGWVALLQQKLERERLTQKVVNASISGDTTAGGRSRLPALLRQHAPSVLVIELGGNDALRGLSLEMTADHLKAMSQSGRAAGAKVLILGMKMPPNFGARQAEAFDRMYAQVARESGARLLPFFLQGIADDPDPLRWFQPDRIHPNQEAQARMLANVWPVLQKLLP